MTLAGSHLSSRCGPVNFWLVHAPSDLKEKDGVLEPAVVAGVRLHLGGHGPDDPFRVDAPLQDECLQRTVSFRVRYCMFKLLRRLMGFSPEEVDALAAPRSAGWRVLRKQHLERNPRCAACGAAKNVVPHHIVPFHIDPSKELDPSNLVTLCESPTFNCHLFFGHLKRWDRHNPHVVEDAAHWKARIEGHNSNR
jgi:5-methylcytosine-specific restriction protein A